MIVHPEPGDRAEEDDGFDTRLVTQEAWAAAQAAVQKRWPDMRPVDAALLSTYAVRSAAPHVVAAAVAAVRADLARDIGLMPKSYVTTGAYGPMAPTVRIDALLALLKERS